MTGKEERGLVPVVGEPLGTPLVYGPDRVFVHLCMPGALDPNERALRALEPAHPVVTLRLDHLLDLGQEIRRWELAAATAASVLGVDLADEPAVRDVDELTTDLLARARAGGTPAEPQPTIREGALSVHAAAQAPSLRALLAHLMRTSHPGDWVAVHAYLPQEPAIDAALARLRVALRDASTLATTASYAPRVLHGAAQLHKGGPGSCIVLSLTADPREEVDVPGEPYGFGALAHDQALGDLASLWHLGRRALRVHLGKDPVDGLAALEHAVSAAFGRHAA